MLYTKQEIEEFSERNIDKWIDSIKDSTFIEILQTIANEIQRKDFKQENGKKPIFTFSYIDEYNLLYGEQKALLLTVYYDNRNMSKIIDLYNDYLEDEMRHLFDAIKNRRCLYNGD